MTNISDIGFDVRHVDATHIRLRTSAEFFYFDKTAYSYEGRVRKNLLYCDELFSHFLDLYSNIKGS